MREIKFRVWDGKQMLQNALELSRPGVTGGGATTAWKKGVEWLQYTGLKDKNGREIYEGDILKGQYECNDDTEEDFYMVIGWCQVEPDSYFEQGWGAETYVMDDIIDDGTLYHEHEGDLSDEALPGFWHNYEVFGNIYENKEQLK